MHQPILTGSQRDFLAAARRAVLATTAADGHARLVPICFVVDEQDDEAGHPIAWSPLDAKPKAVADPRGLARVRDILARPAVTLLVDAWSEDWTRLGWLRCVGTARLVEPVAGVATSGRTTGSATGSGVGQAAPDAGGDHPCVVAALRAKYPQYRDHQLEARPLLRIVLGRATSWGELSATRGRRR